MLCQSQSQSQSQLGTYLTSLPIPLVFSIILSHPHHRYWAIDLTYEETDSIMVIYDA